MGSKFPCLFLDRDGTVNEEKYFISNPDELELIPGSAESIARAHTLGMKVIIVSNQSGVARGFLTERDVDLVNKRLLDLLAAENTYIDGIYYCPHHPENGGICSCRKPDSGMFRQAEREHNVDLTRSIMVGDRMSDIEAGKRIGASTVLVLTGYGSTLYGQWDAIPEAVDHVAANLHECIPFIEDRVKMWHSTLKGVH